MARSGMRRFNEQGKRKAEDKDTLLAMLACWSSAVHEKGGADSPARKSCMSCMRMWSEAGCDCLAWAAPTSLHVERAFLLQALHADAADPAGTSRVVESRPRMFYVAGKARVLSYWSASILQRRSLDRLLSVHGRKIHESQTTQQNKGFAASHGKLIAVKTRARRQARFDEDQQENGRIERPREELCVAGEEDTRMCIGSVAGHIRLMELRAGRISDSSSHQRWKAVPDSGHTLDAGAWPRHLTALSWSSTIPDRSPAIVAYRVAAVSVEEPYRSRGFLRAHLACFSLTPEARALPVEQMGKLNTCRRAATAIVCLGWADTIHAEDSYERSHGIAISVAWHHNDDVRFVTHGNEVEKIGFFPPALQTSTFHQLSAALSALELLLRSQLLNKLHRCYLYTWHSAMHLILMTAPTPEGDGISLFTLECCVDDSRHLTMTPMAVSPQPPTTLHHAPPSHAAQPVFGGVVTNRRSHKNSTEDRVQDRPNERSLKKRGGKNPQNQIVRNEVVSPTGSAGTPEKKNKRAPAPVSERGGHQSFACWRRLEPFVVRAACCVSSPPFHGMSSPSPPLPSILPLLTDLHNPYCRMPHAATTTIFRYYPGSLSQSAKPSQANVRSQCHKPVSQASLKLSSTQTGDSIWRTHLHLSSFAFFFHKHTPPPHHHTLYTRTHTHKMSSYNLDPTMRDSYTPDPDALFVSDGRHKADVELEHYGREDEENALEQEDFDGNPFAFSAHSGIEGSTGGTASDHHRLQFHTVAHGAGYRPIPTARPASPEPESEVEVRKYDRKKVGLPIVQSVFNMPNPRSCRRDQRSRAADPATAHLREKERGVRWNRFGFLIDTFAKETERSRMWYAHQQAQKGVWDLERTRLATRIPELRAELAEAQQDLSNMNAAEAKLEEDYGDEIENGRQNQKKLEMWTSFLQMENDAYPKELEGYEEPDSEEEFEAFMQDLSEPGNEELRKAIKDAEDRENAMEEGWRRMPMHKAYRDGNPERLDDLDLIHFFPFISTGSCIEDGISERADNLVLMHFFPLISTGCNARSRWNFRASRQSRFDTLLPIDFERMQ
ncbi:uncharacterized protein MYCFIDRAFT_175616 [Pseudocercospora fijiensis CIRAD86]|uniref:Uncharacterized protein n=1 Tax=Pseudocercospora fijiensis (strain CIRAD86) TaxID=383855 RepID=M3AX67_PSEFD|nr:uncharacterized protein MYCFIDRAFT_175616 [Pseudocercospora fijiensis CIRAD86]EME82067.1 hypothetical protein MYCFIDRAFT_175616 [Pseudocercospora fijiensis CIRAD86]